MVFLFLKSKAKEMNMKQELKIGNWIGIGMSEVWFSVFDSEKCCFHSKTEIVHDIGDALSDCRKTPKIKKIEKGVYLYTPKSCDTGHFDKSFFIIKVTEENYEKYKKMIEEETEEDIND